MSNNRIVKLYGLLCIITLGLLCFVIPNQKIIFSPNIKQEVPKYCTKSDLNKDYIKLVPTTKKARIHSDYWLKRENKSVPIFWDRSSIRVNSITYKWWTGLQWEYSKLNPIDKTTEELLQDLFDSGVTGSGGFKSNSSLKCAVVGNSQVLRRSCYGELIDKHDIVIRFNRAVIKGFEDKVGSKTTHLFVYPESCPERNLQDVNLMFIPMKPVDLYWLNSAASGGDFQMWSYQRTPAKINVNKSRVKIIHPEFIKYVHEKWSGCESKYPSSGLLGTLYALHKCDLVSLFGFGADEDGVWDHYWESVASASKYSILQRIFMPHSTSSEYNLLVELERNYILQIYY